MNPVIDAAGAVWVDGVKVGSVWQHRRTKRWFFKRGITFSPETFDHADLAAIALAKTVTG